MEAGKPGELPLMRELSSLRRLRALQDPTMVPKTAKVSTSVQTPSWKSPVSRAREVKHHLNVGRIKDIQGSRNPCNKRISSQKVPQAYPSPASDRASVYMYDEASDFDMNAERSLYCVHAKRRSSFEHHRVEILQQQVPTRNHLEDDFSLDDWKDLRWTTDMEASHAPSFPSQHKNGVPRKSRNHVAMLDIGAEDNDKESCDLQNHSTYNQQHGSRRMQEQIQLRTASNNSTQKGSVLSPLVLNLHEDVHCYGKSFPLEGGSYRVYDKSKFMGKEVCRGDTSVPEHLQYENKTMRRSRGQTIKDNRKSRHSTESSTSASQKTTSQSSLSGIWDVASNRLEDELDVYDLPRNGCGIPCYWSKCQRRGKSLLDMAERRYAGEFNPMSPKKAAPSSSKNYSSQIRGGYPGHELVPPLELEAVPLLSDPSACSDDFLRTSDSDKILSDLNGELGLHSGVSDSGHGQGSASDGKELAIYHEKPRSLSHKYRPKVFDELVGQNIAAQALSNAVQKKKIVPVYLFQGPRGTGKTSAARIFAAALNCTTMEQKKPCGSCKDCLAFTAGKSLDIREVDAASNNAVEKVKGLLQTAFLAPSFSHYKIFIIDECHMLTTEAWNVMLKLLEEPPINVVFILTTTDPDKLPAMAVSRCQKFLFPKIKDAEIVERLQILAKLENLNVEPEVLQLVAARADGSLRDAEIILDQLSLLGQRITVSSVHDLFGSVSSEKLLALLDFALCCDMANTVQRARELIDSGVEPLDLMIQMANLVTDILAGNIDLIAKYHGVFFSTQSLSEEDLERLRFALQVLSDSEKQLRAAPNDRTTWLTAALLQLGPTRTSGPTLSTSSASASGSPVASGLVNGNRKLARVVDGKNTHYNMGRGFSQKKSYPMAGSMIELRTSVEIPLNLDEASKVSNVLSKAPKTLKLQSEFISSVRKDTLIGHGNLQNIWQNVLEKCKSPSMRQLLQDHGKLLAVSILADSGDVLIEFDTPQSKLGCERWKNGITSVFQEVLELPIELRIALAANAKSFNRVGERVQAIVDQQELSFREDLQQRPVCSLPQMEHKFTEIGSLHYWRSHNQAASPRLESVNSLKSYPAILTTSKNTKLAVTDMAVQNLSSAPRSGTKALKTVDSSIFEEMKIGGSSQSAKFRGLLLSRRLESTGMDQEIVVENSSDTSQDEGGGIIEQFPAENVFSYDIEQENLQLESQSKYEGLLCWRNPDMDNDQVSEDHQKRGCTALMRFVLCANSEKK
ncbi:hypothetical protein KP509_32G062000 [Ceratopteris richardii]|nr:hypothetical protein KP509_32G062000 [Ceratopteris richardii]KAH7287554.1 hypothetical protein KP509_32G062000 [Ceratopteris richardii]